MKNLLFLLLVATNSVQAYDGYECLAEVIYSEARGEPLAGAIAVGHATLNRAKKQAVMLCKVNGVSRMPIPAEKKDQFLWIAKGIIDKRIKDNTFGSTAWNTGNKPAYPGSMKRVIGKHVLYAQD